MLATVVFLFFDRLCFFGNYYLLLITNQQQPTRMIYLAAVHDPIASAESNCYALIVYNFVYN